MNELENRVSANEIELLRLKVASVEDELKNLKPGKKLLPKIKDIASILTPLILAAASFYITQSITGALQREKLDLDHLSAMKELMTELASPDIERAKAEAVAVSLAAFGTAAVVPLIHELQVGGDIRPMAAEEGLRAVAFRNPEKTCSLLGDVLQNRSGLFSWQTQKSAIRLLGDIGCDSALGGLLAFQTRLKLSDALENFRKSVREVPQPTEKNLESIKSEVERAIAKIQNR